LSISGSQASTESVKHYPKEILLPKSQQKVSPVIDEVLTYPNPSSKPKKVGCVPAMPKHLSGDQVIRFLEECKQKKLRRRKN